VPEIAWPGEELAPHERKVVADLVLDGWTYLYCDGEDFVMQSPEQQGSKDCWRVDRDGKTPPRRVGTPRPVPAPTSMTELAAKLRPRRQSAFDATCRDRAPGVSLRQVRSLVRQGYSAIQVTQMTGWGAFWFADLLDSDGYYNEEREGA
jgi:hypothetical protein